MLIPRGLLADPAGVLRRGTRSGLPGFPEPLPSATEVDVLVVGSGVAGLSAALAVPPGRTVLLATKGRLGHSATRYAQGGIAAVLDPIGDSVAEHVADTLAAGAGLCDPVAVRTLVEEGGQAIADLLELGVGFDADPTDAGELARTREGGHSRSRVVHAGGDATGAELERVLTEAVRSVPAVRSFEHAFLVDLVTEDGWVTGALLWADGGPRLVRAVAELAGRREESRGGHWRSDHPTPVEAWRVRQTLTRTAAGELEAGLLAVPEAAGEARR